MDLDAGNLLPRSNTIKSFYDSDDTEFVLECMLQAQRLVFINCIGFEVTHTV